MDKLNKFTKDKEMMLQVKDYLFRCLKEMALERVFIAGKDITGLKEAGEMVSIGFDKMEAEFADKVEKNITNQSI